jgi:hypothetical protein
MTSIAWSQMSLYEVPGGGHVWGREFQILPAGTMAAAAGMLHGLIGVDAKPLGGGKAEVRPGSPVKLYGTRGTETALLQPYQDELCEAFSGKTAPT